MVPVTKRVVGPYIACIFRQWFSFSAVVIVWNMWPNLFSPNLTENVNYLYYLWQLVVLLKKIVCRIDALPISFFPFSLRKDFYLFHKLRFKHCVVVLSNAYSLQNFVSVLPFRDNKHVHAWTHGEKKQTQNYFDHKHEV